MVSYDPGNGIDDGCALWTETKVGALWRIELLGEARALYGSLGEPSYLLGRTITLKASSLEFRVDGSAVQYQYYWNPRKPDWLSPAEVERRLARC